MGQLLICLGCGPPSSHFLLPRLHLCAAHTPKYPFNAWHWTGDTNTALLQRILRRPGALQPGVQWQSLCRRPLDLEDACGTIFTRSRTRHMTPRSMVHLTVVPSPGWRTTPCRRCSSFAKCAVCYFAAPDVQKLPLLVVPDDSFRPTLRACNLSANTDTFPRTDANHYSLGTIHDRCSGCGGRRGMMLRALRCLTYWPSLT